MPNTSSPHATANLRACTPNRQFNRPRQPGAAFRMPPWTDVGRYLYTISEMRIILSSRYALTSRRALVMKHFLLFAVFTLGMASAQADSDGGIYELKAGVLNHDADGLWSGFSREQGVDVNLEAVFAPSVQFLSGTVRPALGISVNSAGDTSKVYLDARWELNTGNPLTLATGIGVAVHDGEENLVANDRKALGSTVLFHIPIEVIYRMDAHNALSLYFDHMSNGSLASDNEGLDTLGVRYGYRF